MKVLFVRGGNRGVDPISTSQGESLVNLGEDVSYYDVVGRGLKGYLFNIFRLRRAIRTVQPDLIHAHYSLAGFLSSLSLTRKPVITSLMGSDLFAFGRIQLKITRTFSRYIWVGTIVKSNAMFKKLDSPKAVVIPNGVNMTFFSQKSKEESMKHLGWDFDKKHILFASDPDRTEKNFGLAVLAIKQLKENDPNILLEMHYLKNIQFEEMCYYYCAADVLLLTSLYEGSPNVIKEAMACNCPIVSTEVGDVREIISDTKGCYITSFKPDEIAWKLKEVLDFGERISGRVRIMHLSSNEIASQILKVYSTALKK